MIRLVMLLSLILLLAAFIGTAYADEPPATATPAPTATPRVILGSMPTPPTYDPLTVAAARQIDQTCRGNCSPTYAETHRGDCRLDATCPYVPAPSTVTYSGGFTYQAPAAPAVVIRAPNTGDGGLIP